MAATAERSTDSLVTRSNMLLPGLLAWVATLGTPVAERGVSLLPRVTAGAALIALVAGPVLLGTHPRVARALGIHAMMGLAVVTWLLLGPVIGVTHLEPVRAAIGAVAWVLFAFGWGAVRSRGRVPEDDPRVLPGEPLAPRGELPKGATVVVVVGIVGAALTLFSAWRVTRPSHALLAHAVAAVAAIALVTTAARIAVERQNAKPVTPPLARVAAAARPLSLLALVVAAGCVWMLLR